MIHRRFRSYGALAAAVLSLAWAGPARAQERLLLDVYGLSYHTDRRGVHAAGVDNEINPGLGLRYEFPGDARGAVFVQAGVYRDSGRHSAKMAGPGYELKLDERWRAGAALLLFHSATYNRGRAFIAPVPVVGYDLGRVRLNAVYAPRVKDYNDFAVFGLYLSIPIR